MDVDLLDGSRLAGLLLTSAGVIGVLLELPTAPLGARLWTGPHESRLHAIAGHPRAWRSANIGFVITAVLTVAGLFLAADALGPKGAGLALAAAAAFVPAATLWLVALGVRLVLTPGVAAAFVTGTEVPGWYVGASRLEDATYPIFLVASGACVMALGGAVLAGGVIAAVLGWVVLGLGAVAVAGYLALGDMLPEIIFLPTTIIGIALLGGG
jgi:hypothetical protein